MSRPGPAELARAYRRGLRRVLVGILPRLRGLPASCPPLDDWAQPLAEAWAQLLTGYVTRGGDEAARRIARLAGKKFTHWWRFKRGNLTAVAFDVLHPQVIEAVRRLALDLAFSTLATLRDDVDVALNAVRSLLGEGLARGEAVTALSRRLTKVFDDPVKAAAVAQTETSRAVHTGQLLAAKQSGVVTGKRWLASSDACAICLALNGKEVGLDEVFAVDAGGGPYARVDHPPRHPGCQCALTEVLGRSPQA